MTENQPSDTPDYGVRLTGDALSAHQQQHREHTGQSAAHSEYGPQGQQAAEYGPQGGQPGYQHPGSHPTGYQQPGYQQPPGAHYGQPVGGPQLHPEMVQEPQRPATLKLSFWAIIVAGIATLISTLVTMSLPNRGLSDADLAMMDDMLAPLMADMPFDGIEGYLNSSLLTAATIVQAVIVLVMYVLVALGIRSGWRSLRIIGTIFAVLSLLSFSFVAPLVAVFSTLSVVLGIVGIVYAWLPASTEYYRQKAWQKAAKRVYPDVPSR